MDEGQTGWGVMVICPACRATNLAHPGQPPGKGTSYFNRCCFRALTGHRAAKYYGPLSHYAPPRASSGLCGCPLTREDGSLIEPLSFTEFRRVTSQVKYDPKELFRLLGLERNQ